MTEGLPFLIHWYVDDADHPGREPVEHRCAAVGIDWVELGGDQDRLADHDWGSMSFRFVTTTRTWAHRIAVTIANGEPILVG